MQGWTVFDDQTIRAFGIPGGALGKLLMAGRWRSPAQYAQGEENGATVACTRARRWYCALRASVPGTKQRGLHPKWGPPGPQRGGASSSEPLDRWLGPWEPVGLVPVAPWSQGARPRRECHGLQSAARAARGVSRIDFPALGTVPRSARFEATFGALSRVVLASRGPAAARVNGSRRAPPRASPACKPAHAPTRLSGESQRLQINVPELRPIVPDKGLKAVHLDTEHDVEVVTASPEHAPRFCVGLNSGHALAHALHVVVQACVASGGESAGWRQCRVPPFFFPPFPYSNSDL